MVAGGGGGGGSSLRRAAGSSVARAGSGSASENSLLNGIAPGHAGHDRYRLPGVSPSSEIFPVRLREIAGRAAALDGTRLLVVDHASGLAAYSVGDSLLTGRRVSASRITATDGADLASVLDGSGSYALAPGDVLSVQLGPGGGSSPIVLEASGGGALQVQIPDAEGGWRTVGESSPRLHSDELALAAPSCDSIRIVARRSASLSFVGRLVVSAERATVQEATLLSARSSGLGDVTTRVTAADSASAPLFGPDTLALVFSLPAARGPARDCFLIVDATPLSAQATPAARREITGAELPVQFALEQNRPNPFAGITTIRFALPTASPVRLMVFDLMGRRVRTLALGSFIAGYHSVGWDHRDASGNLVRPGVYLYRLIAGSFRDQKKMVLLAN
jgi:hypothetical protein